MQNNKLDTKQWPYHNSMNLTWKNLFFTIFLVIFFQLVCTSIIEILSKTITFDSESILLINAFLNTLTIASIIIVYRWGSFFEDFITKVNFNLVNIRAGLFWGLLIILANGIIGLILLFIYTYFGLSVTPQNATTIISSTNQSNALIVFLSIVLAAPIAEELFFRGILFRTLANKTHVIYALIISGLIFSVIHMDWYYVPQIWSMGILLGLSYLRTGSIVSSIVSHMVINSLYFIVWFA